MIPEGPKNGGLPDFPWEGKKGKGEVGTKSSGKGKKWLGVTEEKGKEFSKSDFPEDSLGGLIKRNQLRGGKLESQMACQCGQSRPAS